MASERAKRYDRGQGRWSARDQLLLTWIADQWIFRLDQLELLAGLPIEHEFGSDTLLVSCGCAESAFKRKTAALSPAPARELRAEIDARLAVASRCFL